MKFKTNEISLTNSERSVLNTILHAADKTFFKDKYADPNSEILWLTNEDFVMGLSEEEYQDFKQLLKKI